MMPAGLSLSCTSEGREANTTCGIEEDIEDECAWSDAEDAEDQMFQKIEDEGGTKGGEQMVGFELEGYGKNQRGHQKNFLCAHLLRCMRKVTKQQSRIYGGRGAGGAQKGKTDLRHSLRGAVWSWLWDVLAHNYRGLALRPPHFTFL